MKGKDCDINTFVLMHSKHGTISDCLRMDEEGNTKMFNYEAELVPWGEESAVEDDKRAHVEV